MQQSNLLHRRIVGRHLRCVALALDEVAGTATAEPVGEHGSEADSETPRSSPSAPADASDGDGTGPESGAGDAEHSPLARYAPAFHGAGVLLSAAALALGGVASPSVGFPIAVGVLSAFGIRATPPAATPPAVLGVVRGGAASGGLGQAAVIKSMFAAALFYRGAYPVLVGGGGGLGVPSILLGFALALSAVGSLLTARSISTILASKSTPGRS